MTSSFATKGNRIVWIGFAVVIAILGVAAAFLILSLPDANAFNAQVERIFIENDTLTGRADLKL